MKLYVGFSKPTSPLKVGSWLIRLWQGTTYSHTFLVFERTPHTPHMIVQASQQTVNMVARPWFFKSNQMVSMFQVEVSDQTYRDLWRRSISTLGAPYSALENLGIVIAKVLGMDENPLSEGPLAYKCSELVYRSLKQEGLAIPVKGKHPDLLDVRDIHDGLAALSQLSSKVKRVWGK